MSKKPSFTRNEKRAMISAMELADKALDALMIKAGLDSPEVHAYYAEKRVLKECIRKVKAT